MKEEILLLVFGSRISSVRSNKMAINRNSFGIIDDMNIKFFNLLNGVLVLL